MTFHELVRMRRLQIRMSQEKLSDVTNMSRQAIQNIENKNSDCRLSNALAICKALGIDRIEVQ